MGDLVLNWAQVEGKEEKDQLWKDQFVSNLFFLTDKKAGSPHWLDLSTADAK